MSEDLEDLVRKSIMFAIIICSLLIFHVALSHEVTAAEGVKTGALSMKRQHEAMETLDRQWTKVKDAVKKRGLCGCFPGHYVHGAAARTRYRKIPASPACGKA
jgi:hypothetical protein